MLNSVLLAALVLVALGGLVISLVLRTREMRASRELAYRSMHSDLLKMAMGNPEYMLTWGPYEFDDDDQERRGIYANLIVSFWQLRYTLGDMDDTRLRAATAVFFAGEQGQHFWRVARDHRLSTSTSRRKRRFHQLLDEEFQKATAQ